MANVLQLKLMKLYIVLFSMMLICCKKYIFESAEVHRFETFNKKPSINHIGFSSSAFLSVCCVDAAMFYLPASHHHVLDF